MKSSIFILSLCILVGSCASKRTSQIYSGIAGAFIGGTIGAVVGKEASPNRASSTLNGVMGGTIGVTAGGAIGTLAGGYFYGEDPENKDLKNMIREQKPIELPIAINDLGMTNLQINTGAKATGEMNLPQTEVPEGLKKYIKKAKIIEHTVDEQSHHLDDNRTLIIPEFKVFEQTYEE